MMQYLDFEQPIEELEKKIEELNNLSVDDEVLRPEIEQLRKKADQLRESIFQNLTRWQRVQLARHPLRPYTLDYIDRITDDFIELHGDRYYSDDKAMVGGLAKIDGQSVDRKSTRLNSTHVAISYAVFCLQKKTS